MLDNKSYVYIWEPGKNISGALLNEFSDLYSNHYGVWSNISPVNPGQKIKLSPNKIRTWLDSPDSYVAYATINGKVIGYAIAIQTQLKGFGIISWGTQLVVHKDHRKQGIGKTLLWSIWGFSDHYAWGVLTPNPYAVRALEKATRRRCSPLKILKNKDIFLNVGVKHVPYVKDKMSSEIDITTSRIKTEFYVDHTDLQKMLSDVVTEEKPWLLGNLQEGWEWVAFTFNDQIQLHLTTEEINQMLEASDQVARYAFSKMMDRPPQPWSKFTSQEVDIMVRFAKIKKGDKILDLGCGNGRHAIELASRGMIVTGVDYLSGPIDEANKLLKETDYDNLNFILGDCRSICLEEEYDLVICVYDVIGTYVDNSENMKILHNIYNHMKKGGRAIISVMNMDLTKRKAKYIFSLKEDPQKLLDLKASQIMEKTGNIFNPNYYLLDEDTSIVYRKEQFITGRDLPTELIVRDRRYYMQEITSMCSQVGLKVMNASFVNAGSWNTTLARTSDKAKEILVICEK